MPGQRPAPRRAPVYYGHESKKARRLRRACAETALIRSLVSDAGIGDLDAPF
jgi:hypothetical protein